MKKILFSLFFLLVLFSVSNAATFRCGNEVVVSAREVIRSNLIVSGKTIHIYGRVYGDVIAAGEEIVIEGRVYGDIIAAGRVIRIQPRDVEDIRVAGQDVFIGTYTGKDVFVAGQYVTLANNNFVGADAVLMGQNLKIGGFIGGGLKASGEVIEQDANLVVRKAREIMKSKHKMHVSKKMIALGMAAAAGFKIYTILILWGLLWLALKLKPVQLKAIQTIMDGQILKSAGVAFLALILLPFIWVLLGISIIGIPLIVLSVALIIYIGFIYKMLLALWLGAKIYELPFLNRKSRKGKKAKGYIKSPHVLFWTGMVAIFIIKLIPVLGSLLMFFSFFWVLGAIILTAQQFHAALAKKKLI